jgi:hypothetical protein
MPALKSVLFLLSTALLTLASPVDTSVRSDDNGVAIDLYGLRQLGDRASKSSFRPPAQPRH